MHKDYELPMVSLTHDEADPEWETYGETGHKIEGEDGKTYYRWHRPPGVHSNYWAVIQDNWKEIVEQYEAHPLDFYSAYHYLDSHPVFWKFNPHPQDTKREANHLMYLEHEYGVMRGILIFPVKCSEQHKIEDDADLNTKTEVWYEFGPVTLIPDEYGNSHWHDYFLDGGADTYEQVIVQVAGKVWKHYGNDRRIIDTDEWKNCERSYADE